MISVLLITMFILLFLIGKKTGIKTFFCFILNFILIIFFIYLSYYNINVLVLSLIISIISAFINLFLLNGINTKTKSSMISVLTVMIIMFILSYVVVTLTNIEGFTSESREIIGTFNLYINYSMENLLISILLIASLGTIIDTSISISSAVNELYLNNNNLSQTELYISGVNVGKDILSTTINTIFFASLGGIMTFFFWNYNLSFLEIINHKMFAQEFFEIIICFIGSIIIIPITSYIISYSLKKD